jgi:multidrug efflux system outer membrane protein
MKTMIKTYSLKAATGNLAMVLLMAGCAVGPNFQEPELALPDVYSTTDSTAFEVANLPWWDLFNDDQLDSLIKKALENNTDIRIAWSRIQESRYVVGYYKSDLWPQAGFSGGVSRTEPSPNTAYSVNGTPYNDILLTANVAWEIDIWGKIRRSSEAAREQLFASEEFYRGIHISLVAEVASQYMTLLDLDNRLQIAIRTLKTRQDYLEILRQRYEKGIVAEVEVHQAEVQEADAAAAIPDFENQIARLEHGLSILLGDYPGPIQRGMVLQEQVVAPPVPDSIPSSVILNRPDVLQSLHSAAAQNAEVGIALAQRLPSLSLAGMIGLGSASFNSFFTADALMWNASANLLGPIFQFNKNKRREQVEREQASQAVIAYEQSVLQAFAEIEDALVAINKAQDIYLARKRQAESAAKAAMLSKERYDGGVTSYLEVLDADRSQFQAELAASAAFQQTLTSYINLYKALGGGWNATAQQ